MKRIGTVLILLLFSSLCASAQTTIRATDPTTGITTNVGDSVNQALRVAQPTTTISGNLSGTTCPGAGCLTLAFPSPMASVAVTVPYGPITASFQMNMPVWGWVAAHCQSLYGTGPLSGNPALRVISITSGEWGMYACNTAGATGFRLLDTDGGATTGVTITAYPTTLLMPVSNYVVGGNDLVADVNGITGSLHVQLFGHDQALNEGNGGSLGASLRVSVANDSQGQTRITDGTNVAAVKAASTAAAATDPAIVTRSVQLPTTLAANGGLKIEGIASGVAVPVTATNLPLPTGASTSANQTTELASLSSVDTKTLPVTASTSGTITAVGNTVVLNTTGYSSLTGYLSTNPDLQSFLVEGTVDGTNWIALSVEIYGLFNDQRNIIVNGGVINTDVAHSSVYFRTAINGMSSVRMRKIGGTSPSTWFLVADRNPYVSAQPSVRMFGSGGQGVTVSNTTNSVLVEAGSLWQSAITDSTGVPVARVKNSSTAAVAADPALVVAISPNNTPVLPSGASTSANQTTELASLASVDAKTPALGQAAMAVSTPVVIANNQTAVPVNGPLTDTQLRATAVPISVADAADVTQGGIFDTAWTGGVSGGSVNSVLKAIANNTATNTLSSTIFNGGDPANGTSPGVRILGTTNDLTQIFAALPLGPGGRSVVVEGNASGVAVPTSVASLPLPTGASTSSLQTTGNTSLGTIAGAVTSAVMQENLKQVNGVTTLTGTGATGTGAQRVTVAVDAATVAGSASLPAGSNAIGSITNTAFTANAGTNLNTSALALDATLTGRTQKTQITDGTRDATVKASATLPSTLGDTAIVVTQRDALPTGTNVIGHVITDTGSTTAVTGNVTSVQATGTNLHMVCDSCNASFVDNSAFTAGSFGGSPVNNISGVFNDGLAAVTSGNAAAARITNTRGLHVNLRSAAGAELPLPAALGTSGGLKVDGSGTALPTTITGNATVVQPTGTNLHIVCDSGCSSSAGFADNSAFTFGTTAVTPIAGVLDDVATNTATENSASIARITPQKGLHINLRNQAGTEIGTAATPVQVSLANTGANATAVKVDGSAVTQPVSGTVTTTPPANASTNLAQVNAVTVLTGSGATGTGSERVTVAVDSATVAGSASLPAGTNVIGHIIADTGSTTAVTQATAANLNATVAQGAANATPWNAIAPDVSTSQAISTTTCTAGTTNQTGCVIVAASGRNGWMVSWPTASTFVGVLVAEASNDAGATWAATFFDAPATSTKAATVAPASGVAGVFSIVPVGGATFYRVRASTATSGTGTLTMTSVSGIDPSMLSAGPNNVALPPTAMVIGAEAIAQGTQPTAATAGNLRRNIVSTEGVQFVQEGNSNRFSCFVQGVTVTTQCQVAPGAGLRAYVTSAHMSNQAATVQTLDIVYGTGTNCGTGTTALTHKWQFGTAATTTSPQTVVAPFQTPLVPVAANAICVRPSAATAFGVTITGYIAP